MTNQWQHSDAIFEELERSTIVIKGKPTNIILQSRYLTMAPHAFIHFSCICHLHF